MKRYALRDKPRSAPFQVVLDHELGEEFDAELDSDIERLLVGAGILEILPPLPKPQGRKQRAESDELKPVKHPVNHPVEGERNVA